MVNFQAGKLALDYPIYGSKFLDENTLLVTGGGGEGNNGVPNKITAVTIDFNRTKIIKRYRELSLADDEDAPTCLDANNNVIIFSCNQSTDTIRSGANNHLRKYGYINNHLRYLQDAQISESNDPTEYTKAVSISEDGSVACLSSSQNGDIFIIDTETLEVKFNIDTKTTVKDLCISSDGKILAYLTQSSLEFISTVTGNQIATQTFPDLNVSKVRFIDNNSVIIVASMKKGQGLVLIEYSLDKKAIIRRKVINKKTKGVTAMSCHNGLIALGGNDTSVILVKASNFSLIKHFPKVHTFAITTVQISPNGDYLASTSADNTINVFKLPQNLATSSSFLISLLTKIITFILVILLGILVQWLIKKRVINDLVDYYNRDLDSSDYFTIQPLDQKSSQVLESSTPISETTSLESSTSISTSLFSAKHLTSTRDISTVSTSTYTPTTAAVIEEIEKAAELDGFDIGEEIEEGLDQITTLSTSSTVETSSETNIEVPAETETSLLTAPLSKVVESSDTAIESELTSIVESTSTAATDASSIITGTTSTETGTSSSVSPSSKAKKAKRSKKAKKSKTAAAATVTDSTVTLTELSSSTSLLETTSPSTEVVISSSLSDVEKISNSKSITSLSTVESAVTLDEVLPSLSSAVEKVLESSLLTVSPSTEVVTPAPSDVKKISKSEPIISLSTVDKVANSKISTEIESETTFETAADFSTVPEATTLSAATTAADSVSSQNTSSDSSAATSAKSSDKIESQKNKKETSADIEISKTTSTESVSETTSIEAESSTETPIEVISITSTITETLESEEEEKEAGSELTDVVSTKTAEVTTVTEESTLRATDAAEEDDEEEEEEEDEEEEEPTKIETEEAKEVEQAAEATDKEKPKETHHSNDIDEVKDEEEEDEEEEEEEELDNEDLVEDESEDETLIVKDEL